FFLFGGILLFSAMPMVRKVSQDVPEGLTNDHWAEKFHLPSSYPARRRGVEVPYAVTDVPVGFSLMFVAGIVSGLLGIGSGALKVLAMDTGMKLPIKVSSATSNFMIGVTP